MGFNYTEARLRFFLLLPAFFTPPASTDPTPTNANRNGDMYDMECWTKQSKGEIKKLEKIYG